MPPLKTGLSTPIYFEQADVGQPPEFSKREIPRVDRFAAKRVKTGSILEKDQVKVLITRLIEASILTSAKHQRSLLRPPHIHPARTVSTRQEAVNRKRRLIAACIRNQQTLNLKQVAKHTKSCYQTVRKVYWGLLNQQPTDTYSYNNTKGPEELERLHNSVRASDGAFTSVSKLKQQNPGFSRKKILEVLHTMQLRWRRLPAPEPKKPSKYGPPNQDNVNRVISELVQVHSNPQAEMLFVDEVKFPLNQTATHTWRSATDAPPLILNRREAPDQTLTAIALCSKERFVAAQLFKEEVTGKDFLNFINSVVAKLPRDKKYLILADNASWHSSALVQKTKAYEYLLFNEPRFYQLNMIENAFSALKDEFRRRPNVGSLQEEAQQIARLFFVPKTAERFAGYARNHLRMLQRYFK